MVLFAKRKRKFQTTTHSKHNYPIAPNILDQDFTVVSRPNQVWVSMGQTLSTGDTIVPAWNMAIKSNNITKELIFHSDRGSQYASATFTDILKRYNGSIRQSMSRKGNCWDNAVAESFFKSLKVEWVYAHSYNLRSEAELSVFQWIETWYNRRRIHSSLGYKAIEEIEIELYNQKIAA